MSDSSRVALVIGVGPGLGAAAARRLAADGFRVAVAARTASKLATIAEEIGGFAVSMDVTDPASIEAGLNLVEKDLGEIHTVVWNVGSGVFGDLSQVELSGSWTPGDR